MIHTSCNIRPTLTQETQLRLYDLNYDLCLLLPTGVSGTTAEGTQLGCAEGLCYVHHTQLATWEQAASLCRETPRGELVTVPDYVTQSSLSKVIRYSRIYVSVWIGARNTGTAWTWQDGRSYIGT